MQKQKIKSKHTIIARTSHESVSPRKANLVLKTIVGMPPQKAINELAFISKRAAKPIIKILKQAIGNAVDQYKLSPDQLIIEKAFATKGRTLKFVRFAGRGRVKPYQKIASHLTIILKAKLKKGLSPAGGQSVTEDSPRVESASGARSAKVESTIKNKK